MTSDGSMRTEPVPTCMLCGGPGRLKYEGLRDRLYGVEGEWSLRECPDCGMMWLSPRPTQADIGKAYVDYYTHSPDAKTGGWLASAGDHVVQAVLARAFGYEVSGSGQGLVGRLGSGIGPLRDLAGRSAAWLPAKPGGRLLDVGCGSGETLRRMAGLGWDVTGVEPDPTAAEAARSIGRMAVVDGDLLAARFPHSVFDAVVMRHVIEHLHDPLATLRECQRVLKPGGRLVVVTPNIRSWGHRVFREAWRGLEPPRHLHLFSPLALTTSVELTGLQVERLRTVAVGSAGFMWRESVLIRDRGRSPSRLHADTWRSRIESCLFEAAELSLLSRCQQAGESTMLMAQKPNGHAP